MSFVLVETRILNSGRVVRLASEFILVYISISHPTAPARKFLHNRTAYANVAGKYQDVLTLEQSVAELHQMFLDFALLTEQQGELLDQIEYQVRSAADYIEDANVDVHEAIEYQKKIRKKQWCVRAMNFLLRAFKSFHCPTQAHFIFLILHSLNTKYSWIILIVIILLIIVLFSTGVLP